MTGSTRMHRFGAARTLALGIVACAATLGPMPLVAGDRSVTMFEGVDEPTPAPAPLPGGGMPLAPLRTENPAGVQIDILPNADLHVGTRIAFKVSAHQKGYLVLVDINAEGRLTQIYPNMMSLSRSLGNMGEANLIRPDAPVTIPNPKNPIARFIFTADLPRGNGVIVAILSDKPVQIIDLPEPSSTPLGAQAIVDGLYQSVLGLKIASSDESGKFTQGVWSFAAAPYLIE